ncbi:nicotinate-nucleotide--dimethylbenzimidazole phosphoribosyltransferase [Kitasatospora sp. NPDC058170]|uniref:nicotinate-nucleotide--dimethylbenzimidazole phosphoribosyltransferase n=1 Tax=Kitasatospora sp. NPDC058170 TaxID=3346364 RepID=UPI0036DBD6CF
MTDGGHVPNEGLPEHLLAGPDPLGGPEGVAVSVAPVQGIATDGGVVPNPAVPGAGLPGAMAPGAAVIPPQGVGVAGQAPGFGVPVAGVPGEGWPAEGAATRPAFHFLDQPDQPDLLDEDDDVLLMPGPQGSWGEPLASAAEPDAVAQYGDGQQAEAGAPGIPVDPSWPPLEPPVLGAADPAAQQAQAFAQAPVQPQAVQNPLQATGQDALTAAQPPRRPLHAGPPIPDPSLMTGHVPVRSLADRGPSQGATPAHGIPVVTPVVGQPEPQLVAPTAVPAASPVQAPQAVPVESGQLAQPVQPAQSVQPAQDAQQLPQSAEAPQALVAEPVAEPVVTAEPVAVEPVVPGVAEVPVEVHAEVQAEPAVEAVPVEAPVPVVDQASPVEQAPQADAVVQPAPADAPAPSEPSSLATATAVTEAGEPGAAAQPEQQPATPAGQPRRISAFLAAPTPHGLPQVEPESAAPQQPAPIATAEQPEAPTAEQAQPVEVAQHADPAQDAALAQPATEADHATVAEDVAVAGHATEAQPADQAPDAADTSDTVPVVEAGTAAETAVGTGEMPSGQAVTAPETEQPQETAVQEADATAEPAVEPEPTADPGTAPEAAAETDPTPDTAAPATEAQTETEIEAEIDAANEAASIAPAEAGTGGPTEEPAPEEPAEELVEEPAVPRGPAAPGYDESGRDAVHQVIRERRDIRNGFRPDAIPHEVLIRVLEAAHTAPSVGYSQPWDFVVIRSAKTRRKMHELAERQREAFADSLPKGRAKQFKEIKIEAILETPVNIVVTADRTRGGRHTLGRHTQPQMAPYSAALAVENLWLAARAEGLGVGWVSFFDEDEMVRELGLPEHLEVVAYLCVGYVDAFPDEPELQQQGWAKKRPLSWVVHEEQYGNRALPGEEPHSLLADTLRGIRPLDAKALGEAWDRQKRMTKPAGSLGMLEIISAQLSGLSRKCPPPIPEPACVAIFAGDHGVHAQGVSPWPQEVTAQMVGNFLAGGAVVNAFAKQIGTEVCVVDVGVASELPDAIQQGRTTGLLPRKVKPGTDDMTQGPAMSREEALKAIEVGIETARDLVAAGNKALVTGDMGIANTTASAALISVFTGLDPAEVTGRGTGIDDETHARKVEVIRAALALHQPDPSDPIGVLAAIGGLEHAAIAGFLLGAASLRTPVILDGVIAGSAALAAKAIAPEVLAACIAGHRSAEPGHQAALAKLGLRPLIDLDLRLGEGTGALLALPLVQSAARAMHDVATFDSAGVTEKA